jgi:hypothetical protein
MCCVGAVIDRRLFHRSAAKHDPAVPQTVQALFKPRLPGAPDTDAACGILGFMECGSPACPELRRAPAFAPNAVPPPKRPAAALLPPATNHGPDEPGNRREHSPIHSTPRATKTDVPEFQLSGTRLGFSFPSPLFALCPILQLEAVRHPPSMAFVYIIYYSTLRLNTRVPHPRFVRVGLGVLVPLQRGLEI